MRALLIVAGLFAFAGVACSGSKGDDLFGTGGGGLGGDNVPDTGSQTGTGGSATGAGGSDTGGSVNTGGSSNVGGGNVTGTGGNPGGGGSAGASRPDASVPTIEAGVPRIDAAAEAGGGDRTIVCGNMPCTVGAEQCCEANNATCVPIGGMGGGGNCPVNAPRLRCDDTGDCVAGQVCCASPAGGGMNSDLARCIGANNCPVNNGSQILCDPAAADPCPGQVNVCSVAQNAIFPNRPFCHL